MKKKMRPIPKEEAQQFIDSDELISSWLEGLAEGTRMNYARTMMRYTRFHSLTTQQLIELNEGGGKDAEKLLDAYMIGVDLPESRKKNDAAAVHSFYKAHYADLAARSGFSKVRYVKQKVDICPTQEEGREITRNAHIRNDALINVLSSGGFRVGTAAKLKWGDFKELWDCDEQKSVWDGKTPVYIGIESKRLKGEGYKGSVEQHTFMTAHACRVLLKYIKWYRSKRKLDCDSLLFISLSATKGHPAFTEMNSDGLRMALKSLGPYTSHDYRRFAQTQLETARVNPNWIRKMQGKKLKGEEDPYSRPKIEQLREAFAAAESFLTLAEPVAMDEKERRIQGVIDSAIIAGMSAERADQLRILFKQKKYTPKQAAEAIQEELHTGRVEQRIINEDELANHLSHGWRFVASLGNGRIVVERT